MKVYTYPEWQATADTLHMVFQMLGKVKLAKMPAQPEWGQILLAPSARGYTTGLIPDDDGGFTIAVDLLSATVNFASTDGKGAHFAFRDNASVADYLADLRKCLNDIGHPVEFSTKPQEFFSTTPFEQQTEKRDFDAGAARAYFDNCVFAYRALLKFFSPYRGKKLMPGLFFGTFDLTGVLYTGTEQPFPGEGIIELVCFDEQLLEVGFWPGDVNAAEPSFFAMPYPFLTKDLSGEKLTCPKAYFSNEKKEFFLTLKDALAQPDPQAALEQFFNEVFGIIARAEEWPNLPWLTKPLLVGEAGKPVSGLVNPVSGSAPTV
ncbi:MAG: DUF5996 family protein [Promicromonosporaceae bacterium]|nr:DUF5996 family protein [Promicromonosporaceae bacterium]